MLTKRNIKKPKKEIRNFDDPDDYFTLIRDPFLEYKSTVMEVLHHSLPIGGLFLSLSNITQGTANNQRVGRSIQAKHIEFCGYFDDASHAYAQLHALTIFIDRQSNEALPTSGTDVLLPPTGFGIWNWSTRFRYEPIFIGRSFTMKRLDGSYDYPSKYFYQKIDLDIPVTFGSSSIPTTNNIVIGIFAESPATRFYGSFQLLYFDN